MAVIGVIAAAAFFFLVLHWWSEGVIEASDALLLDAVFCCLIFGMFAARTPLQFLGAFIPLSAAGAYAIYAHRVGGMHSYLKSQCALYIGAIQSDPRNLAARQRLAETWHALGELDQAITEMLVAVQAGAGVEAQYRLAQWQREQKVRDSLTPVCRWCGTDAPQGSRQCPRCGTPLSQSSGFARWVKGGKGASARGWLLAVVTIALVSLSLAFLPVHFALIPVALFGLALAGWALIGPTRS